MLTGKRIDGAIPLGIDDDVFATMGDHIAYFWESPADFARGVRFLEVGLSAKEHCVVFGHPEANENVVAVLRSQGLPVDDLVASGNLATLAGRTTGEAMLADIGGTFMRMRAGGAARFRLLGNIGWGRSDWPDEQGILAFEASVTEAIANLPCVIVCMYDVRSLPGRLIVQGGFAIHPFTVSCSSLST